MKYICEKCGIEFNDKPCNKRKYCSRVCMITRKLMECSTCKKEFYGYHTGIQRKNCSQKCKSEYMKGRLRSGPRLWDTLDEEERFELMVKAFNKKMNEIKMRSEECWIWHYTPADLYGTLWYAGKRISAHKASYMIHKGTIKKGLWVCHTCDIPRCVNPQHLFLGTPQDNAVDMVKKGRGVNNRGERHGLSKLTAKEVIQIKKKINKGVMSKKVAQEFNVTTGCIVNIKNGRNWSHIHEEEKYE